MGGIFNCVALEARSLAVGAALADAVSDTCEAIALVHRSEVDAANGRLEAAVEALDLVQEPLDRLISMIPEQEVFADRSIDQFFRSLELPTPSNLRGAWEIAGDLVKQLLEAVALSRFDADPPRNWNLSNELSTRCSLVLAIGSIVTRLDRAGGALTA